MYIGARGKICLQIKIGSDKIIIMLADTLKLINQAEEQADNILAKANQTVQDIEKQTYHEIEKINADTDAAIAKALAKLPKASGATAQNVVLNVPENKMQEAVAYITKSFYGA